MTCVVALVDKDKIYVGSDSAAYDESIISIRKSPKFFIKKNFVIGFSHSFRMGQILQHNFTPPATSTPVNKMDDSDAMEYMVLNFIPAMKKCFDNNDFPYHDDEKSGWEILVGFANKLFIIESDWHVGDELSDYAAIGSGTPFALGSFYSTQGHTPEDRIKRALEASEKYCPSVRSPFHIKSM